MTPEEYYATHQKAFRTAFDFLTSHFPPGTDSEWWEGTAKDAQIVANNQKETLTWGLLAGVLNYLEYESKRRMEQGETDH